MWMHQNRGAFPVPMLCYWNDFMKPFAHTTLLPRSSVPLGQNPREEMARCADKLLWSPSLPVMIINFRITCFADYFRNRSFLGFPPRLIAHWNVVRAGRMLVFVFWSVSNQMTLGLKKQKLYNYFQFLDDGNGLLLVIGVFQHNTLLPILD